VPRRSRLDEAALAELAAEQESVVSRPQLAELGADRHLVARRVALGRWQRVGPRVVVLTTGAPSPPQRLWVATLHSGPTAALAGLTAAEAAGLRGFESSTLHTVVPHGTDGTDLADRRTGITVRVEQSRRFRPELLQPQRRPPRLRLATAVVGAASTIEPERRARLLVLSALQQRLVRPDELREDVVARARLRRRRLILESIDDAEGGIHSLPEREWSRAIHRYGLPEPARQQLARRADGTWYLDADFQPWGVGVEINGTQHLRPGAVAWDDHRRNVLGTGGRLMITLSSYDVRHRPGVGVIATAAALLSRGWRPRPGTLARLTGLAGRLGMDLATGDWTSSAVRSETDRAV
jgi:hypothetical protein